MLGFALTLAGERVAAHQQHVNLAGIAAQNLEDQIVEPDFLAAMRHPSEMMRDQTADRIDFIV